MPERVGDVAAAGVLDELGGGQEVPMADAHDPDLLPFPVLVEEPQNNYSIRTVGNGNKNGDTR